MSPFIFSLSLIPLLGVNIWHGYLLLQRSRDGKPHTISEHAAETPRLLVLHRIVHTLSGVSMIILAYSYLLPNGYGFMAVILSIGGVLDSIESLVLTKERSHQPLSANAHQVTAWLMALCYLAYGIFITNLAGLSHWISNSVWVLFALLLAYSIHRKFLNFWIMQMAYFVFLGGVILTAHIKLLTW